MGTKKFHQTSQATAAGAVLIGVVVLLAGCTTGSDTVDGGNAAQSTVAAVGDVQTGRDGAQGEVGSVGAAGAPSAPADSPAPAGELPVVVAADSKVIRTADLDVRLDVEPVPGTGDQAADRDANSAARTAAAAGAATSAREIASAAGGFQASAEGGGPQSTLSLRVPAEQYESVLGKLSALGAVTRRTESSQDVTAQSIDVDSRVKSMTASVGRVRALLAEATTIGDVISIEAELAAREADLESLQQQKGALDGQVAFSTIAVSLTAVTADDAASPPVAADDGFVAGLAAGWSSLLGFLTWSGGVIGALVPFLPFVVVFGALAWWLTRRLSRRRAAAIRTGRDGVGPDERPAAGATMPVTEGTEPVAAGTR